MWTFWGFPESQVVPGPLQKISRAKKNKNKQTKHPDALAKVKACIFFVLHGKADPILLDYCFFNLMGFFFFGGGGGGLPT